MIPDATADPAWARVRQGLRNAVTEATWHLWLEPVVLRERTGDRLVLEVPRDRHGWVQDRYARLVRACAATVLGDRVRVELVPDGAPPAADRGAAADRAPRRTGRGPLPSGSGESERAGAVPFDPRLTFEQFVIGDANRLAHAAALAVAEMPALAYNPLFICGPPGLGKTHLLHSIANYVSAFGGARCRYTTVESFTNHFLAALHGGSIDAFKGAYRDVDVLLVDDVQFLQRKVKTEEEFFHTFNAVHAAGAQIVITSDRLPRDMEALEDRLRERFEAGLVCDVGAPDRETRLTILRKRVQQDGVDGIAAEALELIAERVCSNIRALEGALIRVIAFGSLTGRAVDRELVGEVLDGLYPDAGRRAPSVDAIQEQVAREWGVSVAELVSANRSASIALARQVAMHLTRELTDLTLPAIGRAFGGRNHTTVLHACRRTSHRLEEDPGLLARLDRLHRDLAGAGADRGS